VVMVMVELPALVTLRRAISFQEFSGNCVGGDDFADVGDRHRASHNQTRRLELRRCANLGAIDIFEHADIKVGENAIHRNQRMNADNPGEFFSQFFSVSDAESEGVTIPDVNQFDANGCRNGNLIGGRYVTADECELLHDSPQNVKVNEIFRELADAAEIAPRRRAGPNRHRHLPPPSDISKGH
jgi:hypothetical protein